MNAGLERAVAFATEAHAGQTDKLGQPCIDHCLRVMGAVSGPAKRVAVLHDVVEDTDYSLGDVDCGADLDWDERLALDLLTRAVGEPYSAYLTMIATTPGEAGRLAREVKVADLRDNLGRWVPELGAGLKVRYERALARLTEGENDGAG